MRRIASFARWTISRARREFGLLALMALLAGSMWLFIGIADEVSEGDTRAVDKAILLSLRTPGDPGDPLGPGWVEELGRDATAMGGVGVLTFITVASVIYLILAQRKRTALFVAVAISSGIALSLLLKAGFNRPRPDLVPHGSIVYTTSFPSGHSMMSALVYLTLGALVANLQPRRRLKVYVLSLAILITIAVGVSRVYLGVHWPTDVLAGWAAGATWAMLSCMVALWLQRLRKVEPVTMTADPDPDPSEP
ncbi:MAG: phosphatase PAP2 family protein [Geminicoccaceae bacterium]